MTRPHGRRDSASGWWSSRVYVLSNQVRVECSGVGLGDADLQPLLEHVATKLQELTWWKDCGYMAADALTLDFSCNPNITDFGIGAWLVPFLKQWPACRRLKLYQTSIGDTSLRALSSWISEGHASELHLSDLFGVVGGDAVLHLLREIHQKKKYPYVTGTKGQAASVWLRLEHNGIEQVDELLEKVKQEGISFRVLDRAEMKVVRPGTASSKSPAIDLVLFRSQQQKAPKMEVQDSAAAGEQLGEHLLTLLNSGQRASPSSGPQQDPLPLSVDEFQLWTMEAREDAERGDDERNTDTFGHDALAAGWSFEENLAANARLADKAARSRWCRAQNLRSSPTVSGKHPAEMVSSCSTSEGGTSGPDAEGRSSRHKADEPRRKEPVRDAKHEIEEEVLLLLQQKDVLRLSDFDCKVRQWLHAYRTVGGMEYVREAMRMLNAATDAKRRQDVSRWPAYLVVLLKKFHRGASDGKAHMQAECKTDVATAPSTPECKAHSPPECKVEAETPPKRMWLFQ